MKLFTLLFSVWYPGEPATTIPYPGFTSKEACELHADQLTTGLAHVDPEALSYFTCEEIDPSERNLS